MVPLSVVAVDPVATQNEAQFRALMQAYHSSAWCRGPGETLRYVARHRGQWLTYAVFSAPAPGGNG